MQSNTYTGRFAMAPSQYVLPPDLRWAFSPAKFFTCRFDMAPSRLQHVLPQICDGTFSPATCFTARFAMAPSHLQNFSPADLRCRLRANIWYWQRHLLACNVFHGQRLLTAIFCACKFAMAHLHVSPPDLRWRLLTCNVLHLQI